jgi:hypothetical protein
MKTLTEHPPRKATDDCRIKAQGSLPIQQGVERAWPQLPLRAIAMARRIAAGSSHWPR